MPLKPASTAGQVGRAAVWGLLLILLTLAALGLMWTLQQRPPTPAAGPLPVIGQVTAFTLTNQSGAPVTLSDLRGKVWVADIIFTRCAGPCPRMTQQMRELQAQFAHEPDVRLVTLTTDPAYDTPEILRRYGDKFGAQTNHWWFLTGDPKQIAGLARNGLRLTAEAVPEAERQNPADLFLHSTLMVVVDRQGQLRAAVETQDDTAVEEGQSPDPRASLWEKTGKPRLTAIVRQLLKEP